MAHVLVKAVEEWKGATAMSACAMPAEMSQSDRGIQLLVAVPGCDEKHLRVYAGSRAIAVEGAIVRPGRSTVDEVMFTEFSGRTLARQFDLPEEIAPEEVKAHLHNGMLTILAVKATASRMRRTAMAARA